MNLLKLQKALSKLATHTTLQAAFHESLQPHVDLCADLAGFKKVVTCQGRCVYSDGNRRKLDAIFV